MRDHADVHATLHVLETAALSSGDPGDMWVFRAAVRVHLAEEHDWEDTSDPLADHDFQHGATT